MKASDGGWRGIWAALRRKEGTTPTLSRWAWGADVILALSVLTAVLADVMNVSDESHHLRGVDAPVAPPPPGPLPSGFVPGIQQPPAAVHAPQWLFAVLAALPLVTRRRYPVASFWVVVTASFALHLHDGFDQRYTFAAILIAAYSAVMYSPYRLFAMLSVGLGAVWVLGTHKSQMPTIRPALIPFVVLIPVGFAANGIHSWRQRVHRLEAERETAELLAVQRERARIAQELHDVVTHNVSVMVIQAGAARMIMATNPEKAQEALLAVEAGGRQAMTELRHVMGLLTMDENEPQTVGSDVVGEPEDKDLEPAPGLAQLESLVARVGNSGTPVDLSVVGERVPLPSGVDLTAYRIVQEALTNAMKHASGARITVTVDYADAALRVEVADDGGVAAPSARTGSGRGINGLRERVAVYGGTLAAGPRPTGGYRVKAVIPLEAV